MTLAEKKALREQLLRVRAEGVRSVSVPGRTLQYASDAEMRRAIADLSAEIASDEGSLSSGQIYPRMNKGV